MAIIFLLNLREVKFSRHVIEVEGQLLRFHGGRYRRPRRPAGRRNALRRQAVPAVGNTLFLRGVRFLRSPGTHLVACDTVEFLVGELLANLLARAALLHDDLRGELTFLGVEVHVGRRGGGRGRCRAEGVPGVRTAEDALPHSREFLHSDLGAFAHQTLVIEPVESVGRGRVVSSTVGDLVSGELARAVLACPRVRVVRVDVSDDRVLERGVLAGQCGVEGVFDPTVGRRPHRLFCLVDPFSGEPFGTVFRSDVSVDLTEFRYLRVHAACPQVFLRVGWSEEIVDVGLEPSEQSQVESVRSAGSGGCRRRLVLVGSRQRVFPESFAEDGFGLIVAFRLGDEAEHVRIDFVGVFRGRRVDECAPVFVVVVGHAENQPYGRVFQHCSRCLSDDLPAGPVEIVPAAHRIGVRREEIR